MRVAGPAGPYFEIVEALSPEDYHRIVHVGVRYDTFSRHAAAGLKSAIAQYYGIVRNGLTNPTHAFQGLKRPLMHNGDVDADRTVVIYSWRPRIDWEWMGDRFSGQAISREPLPNSVFVVLVREEENYESGVLGSVEKWNWVAEDSELPDAPVDWNLRYGKMLWTRGEP